LRTSLALAASLWLAAGCTFHHSKQALLTATDTPSPKAHFVTEEDSGLALLGLFQLSEPDHYTVLLERARRKYQCSSLRDAQLDFYTDYWLVLSFPISRITLICEPPTVAPTAASAPAAMPEHSKGTPAKAPVTPPPAGSTAPAPASSTGVE
jgi:hypothetical protein